jgi:hypothetical protein
MNTFHVLLVGITVFLFGLVFGHTLATTAASLSGAAIDTPQTFGAGSDLPMPSDRIAEEQIIITNDRIVLDVRGASWSRFTDTGSMTPFLDTGANAIHIEPRYAEELKRGDIISYRIAGITIIHRIVATGYDEQGWYAIAKGDANPSSDPFKVRFEQIERVLIAIIY